MKKIGLFFALFVVMVIPANATNYDIVCNVDGAACYLDDIYIGQIEDNHLYYDIPYDSDDRIKILTVMTENATKELWINVEEPGWLSGEDYIDVSEEEIIVNFYDNKHPPIGTLRIFTSPPGAKIYFQEDYLGKGSYTEIGEVFSEYDPYELTVYQGYHRIKIWLDGYEPISDRIYVYGDDSFDTTYYLDYVGDHTAQPDLGPDPTLIPSPTPTPEIIVQEKEVTKEVTVTKEIIKEVPVLPSAFTFLIGCLIGATAVEVYRRRDQIVLRRRG